MPLGRHFIRSNIEGATFSTTPIPKYREPDDRVQSAMIANDCPRRVMAPNRWLKVGSSLSRRFPNDTPRTGVIDLSSGSVGEEQISSCFPLARGRHNLPVRSLVSFPKIHARVAPPCHSRRLSAVTSLRRASHPPRPKSLQTCKRFVFHR